MRCHAKASAPLNESRFFTIPFERGDTREAIPDRASSTADRHRNGARLTTSSTEQEEQLPSRRRPSGSGRTAVNAGLQRGRCIRERSQRVTYRGATRVEEELQSLQACQDDVTSRLARLGTLPPPAG